MVEKGREKGWREKRCEGAGSGGTYGWWRDGGRKEGVMDGVEGGGERGGEGEGGRIWWWRGEGVGWGERRGWWREGGREERRSRLGALPQQAAKLLVYYATNCPPHLSS